jgi:ABC-2 type transport system permease protein
LTRVSGAALAAHQFRYDQKVFWRNPASVFFTVLFPLVLFFLFELIFHDRTINVRGGIKGSDYYVPAIVALSVIAATMVGITYRLVEGRESGQLKRVRGTPLPRWAFMAGRIGNSIVITALMVVAIGAIGWLLYGVRVPTSTLPALLLTLGLGAASFSCLGFALASVIPSQDAAPSIVNAVTLPLYFISGILIPRDEIPRGVLQVGDAFPVSHFFESVFKAYNPGAGGTGLALGDLAVVAAWGLAGVLIALRWFRWEPREG